MKCIITTVFLFYTSVLFGNNIGSSLAYIEQYELKVELESKLEENELFIKALGEQESTSNPDTVNTIGAMGMWQFMPYTLRELGFGHITLNRFKSDPTTFPLSVQREALNIKINSDLKQLQDQWFRDNDIDYLEKYVGKKFLDIDTVTVAGILAACHLGGVYGTMRFFDSKGTSNPADVYGSSIYHYLKKFSEYKYNTEKPIKKELECLKILEKDFQNITLLLKPSRLFTLESHLKGTGIASTLFKLNLSHQLENQDYQDNLSLWDLKRSYQNTTEVYYYLGVALQSSTDLSQEMALERLSGTSQKSGKVLFGHMKAQHKYPRMQELSSSTSNQFGMPLGISKYQTCSRNFGFRKLKNFPHLGVG